MSDHEHYSVEHVAAALSQAKGRRTRAAGILGCTGRTVRNYLERYEELRDLLADLEGLRLEDAEEGLELGVQTRQPWAIVFTLRTLGREKYGDKREVEHKGAVTLEHVLQDALAKAEEARRALSG
jgi:hypothetical protein